MDEVIDCARLFMKENNEQATIKIFSKMQDGEKYFSLHKQGLSQFLCGNFRKLLAATYMYEGTSPDWGRSHGDSGRGGRIGVGAQQ